MVMTPLSGVFLLISCVAAIAAVGCVFELSSPLGPDLGQPVTTAILVVSIPASIASFVMAVRIARKNLDL